jgi:thiamine-monophosphate kinase
MSDGEFDIIAKYFDRRTTRGDVLLGIGDDAAVLSVPADRRLVVAMDTIVEGVHFPQGTAAADIGYRALAVNLSDLAAMGAQPAWMTLSLSAPVSDAAWFEGFSRGLFELAERYHVALVGGDTVKGPLVVTVQIAGIVETDRWLTRAGARPGDLLFVSGAPGEAAAGLAAIQRTLPITSATQQLRQRFVRPEPRVSLGRQLRGIATAAMDVSDGLLTDLDKLTAASGCGARVDVDALPLS